MPKNTQELKPEALRWTCNPEHFKFDTTAQLTPMVGFIEQERASRAIRFGLGMKGTGYNIYVAGLTGTGKMTAIKSFLQDVARAGPPPQDWCYVHNFRDPYAPKALGLPAGMGCDLKRGVDDLIAQLRSELPKAFESKEFEQSLSRIAGENQQVEQKLFEELRAEAEAGGFLINATKVGITLVPLKDGQPLDKEQFDSLPAEVIQEINRKQQEVQSKINSFLRKMRELNRRSKGHIEEASRQVGLFVVGAGLEELQDKYRPYPAILAYLKEVQQDILENLEPFISGGDQAAGLKSQTPALGLPISGLAPKEVDPFSKYRVNVVVDNRCVTSPPVIIESNPTYYNLIGRIERRAMLGTLLTDFTMIKSGSLLDANGGYLVVNAMDLFTHYGVWEAMKRVIKNQEIRIEDLSEQVGLVPMSGLRPQPIPYTGKIILVGNLPIYHYLYGVDEDFRKMFKVKADFDTQMSSDQNHRNAYANFVATRCHEEGLTHFDRTGVAAVVEYGARLVDDQNKLTARFSDVADIVRESSYWAGQEDGSSVSARHVVKAIEEKDYRSNLYEERLREYIEEGTILVDVTGRAIGQVNGLAVYDIGDYRFGKPSRITVKTFLGRSGIIDIEREAKLSGRIYNKGVMILSGYLGWKYAQKAPLTLAASICFEQSYEGVDGDSASSTELYALLSSLAELPIRQDIAITGSVNQHGEVQPIGGVNQKIEGFFEVCRVKGLTGEQGVMIPRQNVQNLMLKKSVVDAVREGRFHIFPVRTIDEGIETLTGVPAGELQEDGTYPDGTVHQKVAGKLDEFLTHYQELEAHGDEPEGSGGEGDDEDDDETERS